MKRIPWALAVAALLGTWTFRTAPAEEKKDRKFMGVANCKMCHQKKEDGDQFSQWKDSKHSHAWELLGTDKAKEIAKAKGIAQDPQQAPECLPCHVTGFGKTAELFDKKFDLKDGVQCEACHGAGGDYWKKDVMKDKEKAIAAGLVLPDEKLCVSCHNDKSPNFHGFDFKEMWKKIQHPKPKK